MFKKKWEVVFGWGVVRGEVGKKDFIWFVKEFVFYFVGNGDLLEFLIKGRYMIYFGLFYLLLFLFELFYGYYEFFI